MQLFKVIKRRGHPSRLIPLIYRQTNKRGVAMNKHSYRRVTLEDRCQIDALLSVGFLKAEIARKLGFHRSSIGREIVRNFNGKSYYGKPADDISRKRFQRCRRSYAIKGDHAKLIEAKLKCGWSPEQISGRLKIERNISICHETIYRFIRKNALLRGYLRCFKKRGAGRYLQRKSTLKKRSIDTRPEAANNRKRIGDWERDTFFCAKRRSVLILTDRKSRLTKLKRIRFFNAKDVAHLTISVLEKVSKKSYTITNDNGAEFSESNVGDLKVFYCYPQSPEQRGTVENTIGLLRQYLPRKLDLDQISDEVIEQYENLINLRPRKCLGYKTPYEVFFNQSVALAC
jgi:IS30 family transposase